jgi:GMP synthase (glutamine-hydrolysing)
LFKDEVRAIGANIGVSPSILRRHPFPGPGLAVRCLGEVREDRLQILRAADKIFLDEMDAFGLYDKVWQAGAILLPVATVGVMGDGRTYESVVRQATAAVKNLILAMHGEKPLAQINPEVPVKKAV